MGRAAEEDVVAEDAAGPGQRQVVLAEVEHVGPGGQGDVGPVVDREQGTVPVGGPAEDGRRLQQRAGLGLLVPELDQVHPRAQEPALMAEAMRKAVEAGRLAHRAGRIPRRLYAQASTPTDGVPDLSPRPATGTRDPEGEPRQPGQLGERVAVAE